MEVCDSDQTFFHPHTNDLAHETIFTSNHGDPPVIALCNVWRCVQGNCPVPVTKGDVIQLFGVKGRIC